MLAAAAQHSLPVNVLSWGRVAQLAPLAARNPNTRIVVDHLGLLQPFEPPKPAEPWADLPNLLALARHDNVVVKISGAGTLSKEAFPYKDIWDPLRRIFDAFGLDRCIWGTDWTRAVAFLTYKEGVDAFRLTDRLTDSDRATLMGGTLQKVYGLGAFIDVIRLCGIASASDLITGLRGHGRPAHGVAAQVPQREVQLRGLRTGEPSRAEPDLPAINEGKGWQ